MTNERASNDDERFVERSNGPSRVHPLASTSNRSRLLAHHGSLASRNASSSPCRHSETPIDALSPRRRALARVSPPSRRHARDDDDDTVLQRAALERELATTRARAHRRARERDATPGRGAGERARARVGARV